jgi:prepilin-type N-terminal cleavage/methylation domain-containing protein
VPVTGRESVQSRALRPKNILKCSKVGALSRGGFTLIEIVVALCIVAILTAIAIPGFKKATEDFRLNEFACNFDSLIKAYRSYYLIFNEWPADGTENTIPAVIFFTFYRIICTKGIY